MFIVSNKICGDSAPFKKDLHSEFHGSYLGYHRRNLHLFSKIALLDRLWFTSKRCLDIGCNEGQVTIAIAEQCQPEHILGIDLDKRLILAAESAVKRAKYDDKQRVTGNSSKASCNNHSTKPSTSLLFVPRTVSLQRKSPIIASTSNSKFPNNVSFHRADFLRDFSEDSKFDTVLCLSVTKWVHLNHGDVGLLHLFSRIYSNLVPDGIAIIEYQHWKSYVNKSRLNDKIFQNFNSLKIRPHMFEFILTSFFGFSIIKRLGPTLCDAKGYDRPILVLQKLKEIAPHSFMLESLGAYTSTIDTLVATYNNSNSEKFHVDNMEIVTIDKVAKKRKRQ